VDGMDKKNTDRHKIVHSPELRLLIFFIVYILLLIPLSQYLILISLDNGFSVSIKNWYLFSFYIAVGFIRLVIYINVKNKIWKRKQEQDKAEEKAHVRDIHEASENEEE
jgi:hypothetical protein